MPGGPELAGLTADEAIPRLLEQHGSKLHRLALRLCGDEDEAHDLLQETFLNAYRKWDQFEGRSQATSWLYTIAVRACSRRRRRRAGEPQTMESLEALLPAGHETIAAPDAVDPLDAALARQAEERLSAALVELPLRYRLPLILKDIAELSVEETAAVLGLRPATVKTRVHRARLRLRQTLDPLLPRRPAPPADHPRGVCLDLLRAKQEAMDRDVPFPVAEDELCGRCRSLFATLDLTRDVCLRLGRGELPPSVRRLLRRDLARA